MDDVEKASEYKKAAIQSLKEYTYSTSPLFELRDEKRPNLEAVLQKIMEGPGTEIHSYCEYVDELAHMLYKGEAAMSDAKVVKAVEKIIDVLDSTTNMEVHEASLRVFVLNHECPGEIETKVIPVLKKKSDISESYLNQMAILEKAAVALAFRGDESARPALQHLRKLMERRDAIHERGSLNLTEEKAIMDAPCKGNYFGPCELALVLLGEKLGGLARKVLNDADLTGATNQHAIFALLILGEGDSVPITREGSRLNGKSVKEIVRMINNESGGTSLNSSTRAIERIETDGFKTRPAIMGSGGGNSSGRLKKAQLMRL